MSKPKPLTDAKGEVREVTAKDLKSFRSGRAVLTESLRRKIGVRGPRKPLATERITIRLSREVIRGLRSTGEGWQTRVEAALQEWLKKQKRAA